MNGNTINEDFIEEQGINKADNVQEELKNKILANLKKNLSLDQLENLEELVKKTHFRDKNYID